MAVGFHKFERFFRVAGGVDIDKSDLRRYEAFVNEKLNDLLIRAQATAKANGRDVVARIDVPLTKGLQERVHEFNAILPEAPVLPELEEMVALPPLDLAYGDDLQEWLPNLAGGVSVALAHAFKLIDPDVKNPGTEHWGRIFEVFNQLI